MIDSDSERMVSARFRLVVGGDNVAGFGLGSRDADGGLGSFLSSSRGVLALEDGLAIARVFAGVES